MTLYALLAELIRLCLIALDALWITALAQAFGALPHRLEPWAAFMLTGILMLAVQRLPRWYGYEGGAASRLAALAVGLLPLSRLMAVYAPALVAGRLAGPVEWAAAFVGVWGYSGHFPLTVIATMGLLLWWRTTRIAHGDVSHHRVERDSKRVSFVIVFILLWNSLVDTHFTPWLAVVLGGTILLASALARLRLTIANPALTTERPPVGHLVALIALSSAAVLAASAGVGRIVRSLLAPLVIMIVTPIATGIGRLLGTVLGRFLEWLGPIEPIAPAIPPTPTVAAIGNGGVAVQATPVASLPVAAQPFPYGTLLLILLLVALFLVVLRWQQRRRAAFQAVEEGAALGQGSFGAWLRDQLAARRGAALLPFRRFGTETVRDLYANLLLFGDAHGLPRPLDETPYEYLEPLVACYPARRADLVALTDAYVALRYGEQPVAPAELGRLRAALRRIQQEGEASR